MVNVTRIFEQAVVVIPAHNEAARLPGCLAAVRAAAARLPVPVRAVVVLDACDDGSAEIIGRCSCAVHVVTIDARNVGAARAAGFAAAQSLWGDTDPARIWYATTDADSRVDPDWLVRQMTAATDMVLGVVRIADWRRLPAPAGRHYLRAYLSKTRPDGAGHSHVHGANMGFSAAAYWRVGGFAPLPSGEDVDLAARFQRCGYHICRDAELSVSTSARRNGRAPNGFAAHLRSVLHRRSAEDPA